MKAYTQPVCPVCHRDVDVDLNRALKTSLKSQVYNPTVGLTNKEYAYYRSDEGKSERRRILEEVLDKFHETHPLPTTEEE